MRQTRYEHGDASARAWGRRSQRGPVQTRDRPWLVLSTDHHPFFPEQYISVAVSTKSYSDSIALADTEWEVGGVPRESFASPWALHSPRIEDLETWQGRVSESLVDRVVEQVNEYF